MSANAELLRIVREMAVVLELTGATPFRVNAYTRVARVLGNLKVDVAEIADPEKLTAIEGIGPGTAKKILEYLQTGLCHGPALTICFGRCSADRCWPA